MAKAILNSIEYQTQSKFLEKNCCGATLLNYGTTDVIISSKDVNFKVPKAEIDGTPGQFIFSLDGHHFDIELFIDFDVNQNNEKIGSLIIHYGVLQNC